MSTLKLENIKHENSSTNNMVMNSDGSVSVSTLSGNVGVGGAPVTSYGKTLHIHDTGTSGANLRLTDSNTGSGTGNGFEIITIGSDSYFAQREAGPIFTMINGNVVQKIGSSGRVTMPYQPSFMIKGSSGNKTLASGASVASGMYNPTVLHNVGNHLNTANATFTAPVDGRYYMEWLAYTQTTSGLKNQYVATYLNFSNLGPIYGFHECGPDVCAQISGIFNMSANDTVQPYTYGHASVTQTYIGQHSYFSGHLLG